MTIDETIKKLLELKDIVGGDAEIYFSDSSGYPYIFDEIDIDGYNDLILR